MAPFLLDRDMLGTIFVRQGDLGAAINFVHSFSKSMLDQDNISTSIRKRIFALLLVLASLCRVCEPGQRKHKQSH